MHNALYIKTYIHARGSEFKHNNISHGAAVDYNTAEAAAAADQNVIIAGRRRGLF